MINDIIYYDTFQPNHCNLLGALNFPLGFKFRLPISMQKTPTKPRRSSRFEALLGGGAAPAGPLERSLTKGVPFRVAYT